MLDKLVAALTDFGESLLPWTILNEYDQGVIFRLGRYNRTIGPGFHWRIPLIEEEESAEVKIRPYNLSKQTLTTKDRKFIVISVVMRAKISCIKTTILETVDIDDVVIDTGYGEVAELVRSETWEELLSGRLNTRLTNKCRKRSKEYGVDIIDARIADLVLAKPYRFIIDQS